MNWLLLVLVFIAGTATSIQAGVNGALGKKVGIIEAAFISFLIGTICMTILMIFLRKGNIMEVFEVPKWQFAGGLLGSFYIIIMVIAVPRIGIAAALITLIAGQIASSTLIDHFGFIGSREIPLDWKRILGLCFLGAALFLFYKK